MLWQVPALGLTAQAFLMQLGLGVGIYHWARMLAAGLSIIIALEPGLATGRGYAWRMGRFTPGACDG